MPYVVATQVLHLGTKDGTLTIAKGQRVDSKASYVKNAAAGMFVPADDYVVANDPVVHRAVEAATAAPGETRDVQKPAAKKRAKKPVAKKRTAKKRAKKPAVKK